VQRRGAETRRAETRRAGCRAGHLHHFAHARLPRHAHGVVRAAGFPRPHRRRRRRRQRQGGAGRADGVDGAVKGGDDGGGGSGEEGGGAELGEGGGVAVEEGLGAGGVLAGVREAPVEEQALRHLDALRRALRRPRRVAPAARRHVEADRVEDGGEHGREQRAQRRALVLEVLQQYGRRQVLEPRRLRLVHERAPP
jgi:hypothetical protein